MLRNSLTVITAVLIAVASLSVVAAAGTARGTVYEDLNGDGQRQNNEPGVAGVRVSNGLDIVITDAAGRYALTVSDETIIFLVKPSGYAVPVNQHQLPQFYYIHQPAGSPPGLDFAGVEPTGPLPETIDFPLLRQPELPQFDAILWSDPQPRNDAQLDYIRDDVIRELMPVEARFGLTVGDIMFDNLDLFPRYNALVATLGIPWYNVPGNHELNFNAVSDRYSLETFKRYYGPPYYSFEYGDALFVVLDNIVYRGRDAEAIVYSKYPTRYRAEISARQLQWLENELALVPAHKLVVLAMHAPLLTALGDHPDVATVNRRKLFEIVSGRANLYAIAGHTHRAEHVYFGAEEGFAGPGLFHHHVLSAVSGAWWSGAPDERGIPAAVQTDGTPNGYHLLSVDGGALKVRYRAAGRDAAYQMRIMFEQVNEDGTGQAPLTPGGAIRRDDLARTRVVVNLFDGGPRSQLEVQIGRHELLRLKPVLRRGPGARDYFLRNAEQTRSRLRALATPHLYSAALPADLAPGAYPVRVRAIDDFGQVHHGHAVLEIGE